MVAATWPHGDGGDHYGTTDGGSEKLIGEKQVQRLPIFSLCKGYQRSGFFCEVLQFFKCWQLKQFI